MQCSLTTGEIHLLSQMIKVGFIYTRSKALDSGLLHIRSQRQIQSVMPQIIAEKDYKLSLRGAVATKQSRAYASHTRLCEEQ